MKRYEILILAAALVFLGCTDPAEESAQPPEAAVIEGTWEYHESPEAAGWDDALLDSAREMFDSLSSAAVVVVYQGKVLLAWGDYSGEYLTHSARKSFMSAVYGMAADEEAVGLQKTMAELGIDDDPPLSEQEKTARVIHPAYHFQISARDAARFGLLYLQRGVWKGERLLSEAWIDESTAPVSDSGEYIPGTRYGYMWWVFPEGYGESEGYGFEAVGDHMMYAALGAYGQVVMVIPDLDVVYVHRVDSYSGHNVTILEWMGLLDRILAAGP